MSNVSICSLCYRQFKFTPEQVGTVVKCPDCATEVKLGASAPGLKPGPELVPKPTLQSKPKQPRRRLAGVEKIVLGIVSLLVLGALLAILSKPRDWFREAMPCAVAILVVIFYFTPALVGKDKRNAQGILTLNIFLGWTLIGWIVALVWASAKESADEVTPETHVKCPYCAEPVRKEATLCKHCHSKLSPIL